MTPLQKFVLTIYIIMRDFSMLMNDVYHTLLATTFIERIFILLTVVGMVYLVYLTFSI